MIGYSNIRDFFDTAVKQLFNTLLFHGGNSLSLPTEMLDEEHSIEFCSSISLRVSEGFEYTVIHVL